MMTISLLFVRFFRVPSTSPLLINSLRGILGYDGEQEWEVQRWELHLAEKVNVEKLPGGRLLGGRVGQGLHLHRLLVNAHTG